MQAAMSSTTRQFKMLQANLSSIPLLASFLSFSGYWAFLYCVAIFSNTKFCQFSAAAPASGSTRHHLHPCQLAQHAGCEDPKPTSSPPNPPDQLKFGEADTLLILIRHFSKECAGNSQQHKIGTTHRITKTECSGRQRLLE